MKKSPKAKAEKRLYPPFGFKFSDGDSMEATEDNLRDLAMGMSDSLKWKIAMKIATYAELIAMFEENGFELE